MIYFLKNKSFKNSFIINIFIKIIFLCKIFNFLANINSQSIKVSNESKKPEEIIVKEKIELKRGIF